MGTNRHLRFRLACVLMSAVLCLPPLWAVPGQTTESSSAEGFYGLLKEVITGAAKWGLEESGNRLLGPTGYSEAIDHNQNTVMAYFQRGLIYFNQGDFNSSFYDFNRAVQLNPSFAAGLTNRGASSQNLGRIDAAIADYTASRNLNPV